MTEEIIETRPPGPRVKNLHQRLLAIAGSVGAVKATGKNRFSAKAVSIKDVEDAIREGCRQHGVIIDYAQNGPPTREGKGDAELWLADITIRLVNADDPNDRREARSCDVGSNPSAAVSFALKRYYKALFHVADSEDEGPGKKAEGKAPERKPAAGEMTPAQKAGLQALNAGLSSPMTGLPWTALMQQTHERGRAVLESKHREQCGEACTHVGLAVGAHKVAGVPA